MIDANLFDGGWGHALAAILGLLLGVVMMIFGGKGWQKIKDVRDKIPK